MLLYGCVWHQREAEQWLYAPAVPTRLYYQAVSKAVHKAK